MARRIDNSVLAHLRDVVSTKADSPGAHALDRGPKTEHALPALTRIAGRFSIERRLGQGGMGAVYLAYDHQRGERVALKIVHAGDPTLDVRFEREALALESLVHPGIVRHETHGKTAEGTWFMATEVLAGKTLRERLANELLEVDQAAWLGARLGEVLAYIHERGLVHRDLTPSNIFVCDDGSVRILDFGLTTFAGSTHTLTGQGGMIGTVGFMSPEQTRGGDIDARSDLFSLGCVIVAALTGRPPFGTAVAELLAKLDRDGDPVQAVPPSVPEPVRALLRDLLQRDPAKRPATGLEVSRRLLPYAGTGLDAPAVALVPVSSDPRLSASAFRWRSARGPMVTLVAKQTFALGSPTAVPTSVQDPILYRDHFHGGDPSRSVMHPSDVAPVKPWTDVVVVGRVATDERGAPGAPPRLCVGTIDKSLAVSSPSGALPTSGPVAPTEPARRALLGSDGSAWLGGVPADAPLPPDAEPGFFSCAPEDQRLPMPLKEDEAFVLQGLLAGLPRLVTRLPSTRPQATLRRGTEETELNLRADTLVIDLDRRVCTVTWRTQLAPDPPARLEIVVGLSRAGEAIDWSAIRRGSATTPDDLMAFTLSSSGGPAAPALPFLGVQPSSRTPVSMDEPTPEDPRSAGATRPRQAASGLEMLWTDPTVDDRGAMLAELASEDAWSPTEVEAAVASSLARGSSFPVANVAGTLELPPDEIERARLLVAWAAALGPALSDTAPLESARRAIAADIGIAALARTSADALERTLVAAGVDLSELERALTLRRAYQLRQLLGGRRIRTLLGPAGSREAIPCYLPDTAGAELPLAPRFVVRIRAELLPRKDDAEISRVCLRPLAIARAHF